MSWRIVRTGAHRLYSTDVIKLAKGTQASQSQSTPWFVGLGHVPIRKEIPSIQPSTSTIEQTIPQEYAQLHAILAKSKLLSAASIKWTNRLELHGNTTLDTGWQWIVTATVCSNRGPSALRAISRSIQAFFTTQNTPTTVCGFEGKRDTDYDADAWIAIDAGQVLVNVFQTEEGSNARLNLTTRSNEDTPEPDDKQQGRRLLELAYEYGFRQNPLTRKERSMSREDREKLALAQGDYTHFGQSYWSKRNQALSLEQTLEQNK